MFPLYHYPSCYGVGCGRVSPAARQTALTCYNRSVSKGIGGYVRRSERRYVPPLSGGDDDVPRCERCHARLDLCVVSPIHICKEFTFQSAPLFSDPYLMSFAEET
jgi:hypothetical protein